MGNLDWQSWRVQNARDVLPYFQKWMTQLERGSLPALKNWMGTTPITTAKIDQLMLTLGLQLSGSTISRWLSNIPAREFEMFSLFVTSVPNIEAYVGLESIQVNINYQIGGKGGNYYVQPLHLAAAALFLRITAPSRRQQ